MAGGHRKEMVTDTSNQCNDVTPHSTLTGHRAPILHTCTPLHTHAYTQNQACPLTMLNLSFGSANGLIDNLCYKGYLRPNDYATGIEP